MNHIVHFKVKKKFHAPCGWEILPENYLQQAITNAQFHLHQDFMNESDFQIIEGFTQSVCEICQWNVGLKVVGGAKSSTSIYRGTTWIMYGFSSCTTSWCVNKL